MDLYGALARMNRAAAGRNVYEELEHAERRHVGFWEERLRAAGHALPAHRRSLRTRILILLARHLGAGFIVPSVVAREMSERDLYASQSDAREAGLADEEHDHAATLRFLVEASTGNNLRAAVLGANDGLSSNFCLMMGVAGAGSSSSTVLLTGVAGLVAGSVSMALGEWLSVTNARELALSQLDRAMDQPTPDPHHASVAAAGDAGRAAAFSFALFAVGALIPVLPMAGLPSGFRTYGCVVLSLCALFSLGLATSLFNARSALFSGLRQVMIGAAAAAVTYLVGRAFGGLVTALG